MVMAKTSLSDNLLLIAGGFIFLFTACGSNHSSSLPLLWKLKTKLPGMFIQNLNESAIGVRTANEYSVIDKTTGNVLQHVRLVGEGQGGAWLEKGRLYYGSSDHFFRCVDIASQTEIWKFETKLPNQTTPVVDSSSVYWGSVDSSVYAVNKNTGELLWKFKTGCHIYGSGILVDSLLIIGSWDTHLYALNKSTGKKVWRFHTGAGIDQTPLLTEGRVWLANYDQQIYEIDPLEGRMLFRFSGNNAFEFNGVQWKDNLLFTGIDRELYGVTAENSEVVSLGQLPVAVSTTPLVHENLLITGHYDGTLYAWTLPQMKKRLIYRFRDRVNFLLTDGHFLWAISWDHSVISIKLSEVVFNY